MFPPQAGILDDVVFSSSTLAEQTSMVLQQADNGFVTITHDRGAYVLLRRDWAAGLMQANRHGRESGKFLAAASRRLIEPHGVLPSEYQWLSSLSQPDLQNLILEITPLLGSVLAGSASWAEWDAVIYEWQQSCLAATDPALREAYEAPNEAIPLSADDSEPATV